MRGRKITLSNEQLTDFLNLGKYVYSPLQNFVGSGDFKSILDSMRLESGEIWPIPIVLDVNDSSNYIEGTKLVVQTRCGVEVGTLDLDEVYRFDKDLFCYSVFGTNDAYNHPGVKRTQRRGDFLLAGKVELKKVTPINGFSVGFPEEVRREFDKRGWNTIVGFQTRNPPHRGHEYIQRLALEHADGLFISPILGNKKQGDFRDDIILKCYKVLVKTYYPPGKVILNPILLNIYYAGPKEAVLHTIIRKNYGCTHFIVGRDHAGVGNFYGLYDAQKIFDGLDIGIQILRYKNAFYCSKCESYATEESCGHDSSFHSSISGNKLRRLISEGKSIPELFLRKEVSEVLRENERLFVEGEIYGQ